jgi:hypothetical protein
MGRYRVRPTMKTILVAQLLVLAASLPLQLLLVPTNQRRRYFTPGELRFWSVAIFIIVEIIYLAAF